MSLLRPVLLAAFSLPLLLGACGGADRDEKISRAVRELQESGEKAEQALRGEGEDLQQRLDEVGEALGEAFGGAEAVAASDLKALLPEELPGMERISASAERRATFGMQVASAEASYHDEDGAELKIVITDMGTMTGLARLGLQWMDVEVDQEDKSGYRKSTEYRGHRAFETSDRDATPVAEMTVLVKDRFVVKIEGPDMDRVKTAMKSIDIEALEGFDEAARKRAAR